MEIICIFARPPVKQSMQIDGATVDKKIKNEKNKNSLYFIKFKTSSASSAFWFLALYRKDKTRNSIPRNLSVSIRNSFHVEFDR